MVKLEKTLKAVANRRRLAILEFLKTEKEAPVGDIASKIKLSFRSTSKHLAILSSLDILEKTQKSSQVFYCLSADQHPVVKYLLSTL